MNVDTNEGSGEKDDCPESCTPNIEDIAAFQYGIAAITGKWKVEILCGLMDGAMRFGELRRSLPGITQHMLTAQLRELESNNLVSRTAFAEIPPRVDYALTEASAALKPVFDALLEWSRYYGKNLNNNPKKRRPALAVRAEKR